MLFLAADAPAGGTALILTMLPWLVFIFFFYWLFVAAPMKKKQKAFSELMSNLKTGNEIVTNSGLYGTIIEIQDKTLKVRIANNVVIKLDKSAVAGLAQDEKTEEKKEK